MIPRRHFDRPPFKHFKRPHPFAQSIGSDEFPAGANRIECADTRSMNAIISRSRFRLFEDCHLTHPLSQDLPGELLSRQYIWIVETWNGGSRLTTLEFCKRHR